MAYQFGGLQGAARGAAAGGSFGGGWGALGGAIAGFIGLHDWLNDDVLGLGPQEYDASKDVANQAKAIEMTQYALNSPYGTVDWTGSINDGTRKLNITLSPTEQAKYDSVVNLLKELNADYGDKAAKRAEDAVYESFQRYNTPAFEKNLTDLQTKLVNQGIPVGSEAYKRAMQDLYNTQYDANLTAANQAVLTGNQTKISELGALINLYNSINQSINNPTSDYNLTNSTSVNPTYSSTLAQQQANQQSQAASIGALASAIPSIISAIKGSNNNSSFANYNPTSKLDYNYGSGSYLNNYLNNTSSVNPSYTYSSGQYNPNLNTFYSDVRMKENIEPIGKLYNGLTVYKFNFIGENITKIGLIAQEVKELMPYAVSEDSEGLLLVNYDLALQMPSDREEINQYDPQRPDGNEQIVEQEIPQEYKRGDYNE
ncbi:MAG: tail fiber domain-containing protein [Endomicrobium sp.]|jgi:hypothetical protein|nr:tail fiber domain-containing protein [Endomicrobium sp.]